MPTTAHRSTGTTEQLPGVCCAFTVCAPHTVPSWWDAAPSNSTFLNSTCATGGNSPVKCVLGEVDERALSAGFPSLCRHRRAARRLAPRKKSNRSLSKAAAPRCNRSSSAICGTRFGKNARPWCSKAASPHQQCPASLKPAWNIISDAPTATGKAPCCKSTMWISKSFAPTTDYEIYKAPHTSFHFR